MKQYPYKFKLCYDGIEWYQTEATLGSDDYFYYFKFALMSKQTREAHRKIKASGYFKKIFGTPCVGLLKFWYDCPHAQLNLYYITIYWSTQWTKMPKDYWA